MSRTVRPELDDAMAHARKTQWAASRRGTRVRETLAMLFAAAVLSLPAAGARAAAPVVVVVADFDYSDTSGEVADQVPEHRARVAAFGELLRQDLGAEGQYRVLRLDCPDRACTAGTRPDDLVAAARRSGARLLVYGGIRKMSTLIQWGEVQLLDLDSNQLLLRRTVTFRGDTDMAFRRAAEFVVETLKDVMPKP
jgi:Protein of unknown function (DUF2380)